MRRRLGRSWQPLSFFNFADFFPHFFISLISHAVTVFHFSHFLPLLLLLPLYANVFLQVVLAHSTALTDDWLRANVCLSLSL